MEVHLQTCQACGCNKLENLILREPESPQVVLARCSECGKLVARYELSDYYHHGKDIESYLRAQGNLALDSGRTWLAKFERVKKNALESFERAQNVLKDSGS